MNKFEEDLKEMLGEKMKNNDELCREVWSSLANVDWHHPESNSDYSCSFRYAGGLISEIIGEGDYMDWYCSGPYAVVSDVIARSMKKKGWIYDDIGQICDEPGCIEPAGCGWPSENGYRHTCGKHYAGKLLRK